MKCLLYLFTLLLMLMPHPVFAMEQTQKLTANDGAVGDYFGCSVSISSDGNYAVVGAENVDRESANVGAAFVFKKSEDGSWVQQAKLTEKDGTHYDSFGCSVSISSDGSYIVVGARKFNNPGAAYVFKQPDGGWATTDTYTAKLTDKNGGSTAKFGCSVSISSEGSYIAVGAEEMKTDGHATGAAYVFKQPDAGWATTDTYTAKLTDKNSSSTAKFGCSVSISSDGGYLVVGAEEMETDGTPAGAAYVFKQPDGGWATTDTYTAMLTDKEGRGGDDFGCSVSVSSDGGYALVGASSHPFTGEFTTGAAYVFKQPANGWATTDTYAAKLTASDGANDDRFGDSVSISSDGSYILVGANLAPYDSEGSSPGPGAAYVFKQPDDGWATTDAYAAKLTAKNGADEDFFGYSVSISPDGSCVLVGAFQATYVSGSSPGPGAAYVYLLPPGMAVADPAVAAASPQQYALLALLLAGVGFSFLRRKKP